ncbi:hypothetical protein LTR85_010354 [Meristemomyces frigidus]|nr:hypothetical protein LTR85_010354 [Meristemomyces frigidus]
MPSSILLNRAADSGDRSSEISSPAVCVFRRNDKTSAPPRSLPTNRQEHYARLQLNRFADNVKKCLELEPTRGQPSWQHKEWLYRIRIGGRVNDTELPGLKYNLATTEISFQWEPMLRRYFSEAAELRKRLDADLETHDRDLQKAVYVKDGRVAVQDVMRLEALSERVLQARTEIAEKLYNERAARLKEHKQALVDKAAKAQAEEENAWKVRKAAAWQNLVDRLGDISEQ